MSEPAPDAVGDFVAVMRRLRAECPWRQQQTHRSLARYLVEETHEALEAIDTGDLEHLREELGDLLLQVVIHSTIAEETGAFTLDEIAREVTAKMVRRNPHVFGDDAGEQDAASVTELYEQRKAEEKGLDRLDHHERITRGLPPTLPALLYADKVLDRLARDGRPVEAPADPDGPDDLGDRLLALVAEARAEDVDPEQALRDAVRRLL